MGDVDDPAAVAHLDALVQDLVVDVLDVFGQKASADVVTRTPAIPAASYQSRSFRDGV